MMRKSGKSSDAGIRYFTVTKTSIGKIGGRYSSKSGPATAAKKAASKRFGSSKSSSIRLTVREIGTDKEFIYDAEHIKLTKPVERKINGRTVTSQYRVEVKKVAKAPIIKGGGVENKYKHGELVNRTDVAKYDSPQWPQYTLTVTVTSSSSPSMFGAVLGAIGDPAFQNKEIQRTTSYILEKKDIKTTTQLPGVNNVFYREFSADGKGEWVKIVDRSVLNGKVIDAANLVKSLLNDNYELKVDYGASNNNKKNDSEFETVILMTTTTAYNNLLVIKNTQNKFDAEHNWW